MASHGREVWASAAANAIQTKASLLLSRSPEMGTFYLGDGVRAYTHINSTQLIGHSYLNICAECFSDYEESSCADPASILMPPVTHWYCKATSTSEKQDTGKTLSSAPAKGLWSTRHPIYHCNSLIARNVEQFIQHTLCAYAADRITGATVAQ